MRIIYKKTEQGFERLTAIATAMLGNSIVFIIAACLVLYWLVSKEYPAPSLHQRIGDLIVGITFLSLFIIQKTFKHFAVSLHLKLNELVASHEKASNKLISVESKTEHELIELSQEYAEMAATAHTDEEILEKDK